MRIALGLSLALALAAPAQTGPVRFRNVTEAAGVRFLHTDGSSGRRYVVDNVAEALAEPGQWYLDRRAGTLTYLPRLGEDPRRSEAVAPKLERLVVLEDARRGAAAHRSRSGCTASWRPPGRPAERTRC